MGTLNENLTVRGHLVADSMSIPDATIHADALKSDAEIQYTHHKQRQLDPFPLRLSDARTWDQCETPLPGTPATGDLALDDGDTYGTTGLRLLNGNAAGTTTVRYARWPEVVLPANYDAGQTIVFRFNAKHLTEIADTHSKMDLEVRKADGEGGNGAEICATAEQSINSTTAADYDFTVTATGLEPGDVLDIRLKLDVSDVGSTTVDPIVGSAKLLCDTKG